MNEPQVVPFAVALAVCLVAAPAAWVRPHRAVAHTINFIPVALITAVALVAWIRQPPGQARPGDLLWLAGLISLAVINVVAIVRSARLAVLFWLTWLVNFCLLGGLIYLQFFLKIF